MTAHRDPHVTELRYKLAIEKHMKYENPPPVEFESAEARFKLDEDRLVCLLKLHFADVASARKAVEPVIEAWEASADLTGTRGQLRFQCVDAEIIDRDPRPADGAAVGSGAILLPSVIVSAQGTVGTEASWHKYPDPPGTFRLTLDADTLLHRYRRYLEGHEPLPSMAYFCYTFVKVACRGRPHAALAIKPDVLRTLKTLSSERGDRTIARKAINKPQPRLTSKEQEWLEAAVKMLIFRVGDAQPSSLPEITMSDLPPL